VGGGGRGRKDWKASEVAQHKRSGYKCVENQNVFSGCLDG